MGLPVWREPKVDERKVMVDATVAPRSSIRRTHTIRAPDSGIPSSVGRQASEHARRQRMQSFIRDVERRELNQTRQSHSVVVAERNAVIANRWLVTHHVRMNCRNTYADSLMNRYDEEMRSIAMAVRDEEANSYENAEIETLRRLFPRTRLPPISDSHLGPYATPIPEDWSFGTSPTDGPRIDHPSLPDFYVSSAFRRYRAVYSGPPGGPREYGLTPGFAPANPHQSQTPPANEQTSISSLPPLRRMGRREFGDQQNNVLAESMTRSVGFADGLGDRDRSVGPEDTWQTFLTTIPLDERTPSAASSFTSAMASASASNLNSNAASSTTSLTEPVHYEHECDESVTEAEDSSESEGEESITSEEEDQTNTTHRQDYFRHREAYRQHLQNEQALGHDPPQPWRPRRVRTAQDLRRHEDNAVNARRIEDEIDEIDEHDDMRRIIAGLAQRTDIPDNWWANAGLYRHLPNRDS